MDSSLIVRPSDWLAMGLIVSGHGLVHVVVCRLLARRIVGTIPKSDSPVAQIVAVQVVSFISTLVLSLLGIAGLIRIDTFATSSAYDRVFSFHPISLALAWVIIAYQCYSLFCSLYFSYLRQLAPICHHVGVIVIGLLGLHPLYHPYGIFFFGLVELSSLPLCFIDIFKVAPHLIADHPQFYSSARLLFASLFLIFRVFFWLPMTYLFWKDSLSVIHQANAVLNNLVVFMIGNVLLTALQLLWAVRVVKGIYKALWRPRVRHVKLDEFSNEDLSIGSPIPSIADPEYASRSEL